MSEPIINHKTGNKNMSVQDFNLCHDFRVQFSSSKNAYYLFDSQNKVIAIFPQEKRNFEFFSEYVKHSITHMQNVFFYSGKFKKLYKEMTGSKRKDAIWKRIEKDECNS